jgi:hypothetical protein
MGGREKRETVGKESSSSARGKNPTHFANRTATKTTRTEWGS